MKKCFLLTVISALVLFSCEKEPVEEPVTVSFGMEVSVTDSSASVKVVPSDDGIPYYCDVMEASEYEDRGGSALLIKDFIWEKYSEGEIEASFTGKNTVGFPGLEPSSEYVAVCAGFHDGDIIDSVGVKRFVTGQAQGDTVVPPVPEYGFSLDVSLTEAGYRYVDLKVGASDGETVYILMPVEDGSGLSDDQAFEDLTVALAEEASGAGATTDEYLYYLLEKGRYVYKGSKDTLRLSSLTEGVDYTVFAFGVDGSLEQKSEVERLRFSTKEATKIDCGFDVECVVEGRNVTFDIVPDKEDVYWFFGVLDTDRYETLSAIYGSVEDFVAVQALDRLSSLRQEDASLGFMEAAEKALYKGSLTEYVMEMDESNESYTYFMAALLPVDEEILYPISVGVAESFMTDNVEQNDELSFEITAAADSPESGHLTVIPSIDTATYVLDCVPLSQWKSLSDEERLQNWVDRYNPWFNIGERLYTGTQTMTDMELYPNTEYIAFAFGYADKGSTTEFYSETFTTPALTDPAELELELEYYNLTYNTVKVDVTPNHDDIFYFVGLAPTEGFDIEYYASELEDDLQYTLNFMMNYSGNENYVVAEDVYDKCLRGARTGLTPYDLGMENYRALQPGTSYTFYWFAVSTDTGCCVRKESVKDFIVTPVMFGGTATVDVNIPGFYDQREANEYVDSDYFPYRNDEKVVFPIEITGMSDNAVEVWFGFSGGANFEDVTDEWLFTSGIGGYIQTKYDDVDKVMYRMNENYNDYIWFFFAAKDKDGVFGPVTKIGIDTPPEAVSPIEELKAFYEEHKDNMY